jgi:hypothetical protein
MKARQIILSIDLSFASLTLDLEGLLLWGLLGSLSLDQLVVLGVVVVLAALRSSTAPSSCR